MSINRLTRNHNIAKRKLDECDVNEHNKKKRKITSHKISNKLNSLIESNKSLTRMNHKLTKQNEDYKKQTNNYKKKMEHYKEGVNIYKKETDKWKSEYLKLKSQLNKVFNNNVNINNMQCDIEIEIQNESDNKNQSENENDCENENDSENEKFTEIVDKNTNNNLDNQNEIRYNLRSANKSQNINTIKNAEIKTFDNSYYIRVNCHICDELFYDIKQYAHHIKQHYENDHSKRWLSCDFGCNNRTFKHYYAFIPHIAMHTKNYPYHCLLKIHGNDCRFNSGTKGHMKIHYEYHKKLANKILVRKNDPFENCCSFQMDCHICQQRFNNYYQYEQHIKDHYDDNSNKKWLECDLGCTRSFKLCIQFIAHIAKHTKQRPFQCNVVECDTSGLRKVAIQKHWKTKHSKQQSKK